MKFREGFITNSSSSIYLVQNITEQKKNMLDLLREAAKGEWFLVQDSYYNKGSNYRAGDPEMGLPQFFPSKEEFLQCVKDVQEFEPDNPVEVEIVWGDGEPILCSDGLREGETASFKIEFLREG